MPTPRHRALRQRSIIVSVLLVLLGSLVLTFASPGGPPFASAATEVSKTTCKKFDPNLVNGMCLKYTAKSGTGYTWIGSYKADNGKVFFCIDYLYDSRIVSSASVVDTNPLMNQLGKKIGAAEVAALNYLISTQAPNGSTGSDGKDAAIALIIREVMSDAIRPDGTVVYKPGLKVGGTVAAPTGGLSGSMLTIARSMWDDASRYRGPGTLVLDGGKQTQIELGDTQEYQVSVLSAGHHPIPGLKVSLACYGPITCPSSVTTKTSAVTVKVTPTAVGQASIKATTSAPSGNGELLRLDGWHTHGGSTAADNGVQRGWIGQRNRTAAEAKVETEIVKGTPTVTTRTSAPTALPGTSLADLVTVSGLPSGSTQQVTATLFGPFPSRPTAQSCTAEAKTGEVTFQVAKNGTFTTPTVKIDDPGYYVWTESMPGDDLANPVTTPCGIADETTVVERPKTLAPRRPTVHTVASSQHVRVGDPLRDLVDISGLTAKSEITVGWQLLGPVAPRSGSCARLSWSKAKVAASGSFKAPRDGRYLTTAVKVGVPGCFTYTEHVAATTTTTAVRTKPGEASETVLVTRPATPVVPEIPSGPASRGRR
ncbi:hypothetical protein [Nocardioides marmorisolisilvae]|uniref:Uncharacterized protein n=1 Tax=Nocardioides marmorisolisilvae TaxID=1542737 RepID=A0A3N0DRH9_9ACTN|nr:hypothetical protein [Nocardioides marmorisolisilvae]RNL78232.1 hypothetical protein EFL95_03720 [Nocardioides marmorisolisilvae]